MASTDQNLARQLATLGEVDRLFEEKQSGARRAGRTVLADLIGYAREGDTVVVSSMDRLARSVVDLNQIVGELVAKGVVVEFLNERVTFLVPSERTSVVGSHTTILKGFFKKSNSVSTALL